METCKTCKAFLNLSENNEMGECRRHSPSIGGWPKVFGHSWCLEYSEKINLNNQHRGGLRYTEDDGLKPKGIKLNERGVLGKVKRFFLKGDAFAKNE
jgi:hypothetical protein